MWKTLGVLFYTLSFLTIIAGIWYWNPVVGNMVIGFYFLMPIGFLLPLFLFGLFVNESFLNVPYETNDANEIVEGRPGYFTRLEPGEIKILERAGKFQECLMDKSDHTFKGQIRPDLEETDYEYWDIVLANGHGDFHPIPLPRLTLFSAFFPTYRYLWWVWQRFVYHFKGYVFTGLPQFQTVRTYLIEYFRKKLDTKEFALDHFKNRSDRFEGNEFDFFVPVPSADTADKVPVKVTVAFRLRCINPKRAAYNTDPTGWTTRVLTLTAATVNDTTRGQKLTDVIAGTGTQINDALLGLADEFALFGFMISKVSIPDRSVVDEGLLSETQKRLAAAAFAQAAAEATRITGKANADVIKMQAKAITAGGTAAELSARLDAQVRTVQAAGDRAIVNVNTAGGSASDDATLPAILKELRELTRK